MPIKSIEQLVSDANKQIVTLTAKQALQKQNDNEIIFVDIRDIRELEKSGKILGAEHAPRGMLEFWFDPACEYHRSCFADINKTYVLYCAIGWRSALAAKTLQDMGVDNIAHVEGGFASLCEADADIQITSKK